MEIYYQDKDIIVCHKPYGACSQKSTGKNMVDLISEITHTEVFPVHRLDITTEGLMVYALNKESAASLSAQISARGFVKTYVALVHGEPEPTGELVDYIYHDKNINKSFVVKRKRQGVKEARLEYSVLSIGVTHECEAIASLQIRLHTGRSHQIRVQLASRGFPLYGDKKYGASSSDRIWLFSTGLSFEHPKTGETLHFELKSNALIGLYKKFSSFNSDDYI